jgi:hypothetical protein
VVLPKPLGAQCSNWLLSCTAPEIKQIGLYLFALSCHHPHSTVTGLCLLDFGWTPLGEELKRQHPVSSAAPTPVQEATHMLWHGDWIYIDLFG